MRRRSLGFWILGLLGAAIVLWIVGGVVIVGSPAGGFMRPGLGFREWGPGLRPWMMTGPLGWGAMLAFLLARLLFWSALILGAILLVRRVARGSGRRFDGPDALELARRRYARGEISREEYQRLRDDLTAPTPAH
jgi:putative membrane protein